jgi:N-acetylglucosaminyl-diphospho-decaprenol L-rhamnosyltransferase
MNPAQAPQFSAVVVSFHTGAVLTDCLTALLRAPLCQQIVLVNNGNPPDVMASLAGLAVQHSKLKIVDGHGNIGFGRGCNLGSDHADCEHLVFVNPDCIVDDCTLAAFAEALANHPTALCGGALRNMDGSEQRGCRRGELTLWSALVSFIGLGQAGAEAGTWRDFNRNRETVPTTTATMPTVSGALMATARTTFDAIGGFDAAYFLHVEDIDLCKRMRGSGGQVLFVPNATALHIGATSNASNWAVTGAKINSFTHYFLTHARGVLGKLTVIIVMPFLAMAIIARSLLR